MELSGTDTISTCASTCTWEERVTSEDVSTSSGMEVEAPASALGGLIQATTRGSEKHKSDNSGEKDCLARFFVRSFYRWERFNILALMISPGRTMPLTMTIVISLPTRPSSWRDTD